MSILKSLLLCYMYLLLGMIVRGQTQLESALTAGHNQTKPQGFLNVAVCPAYEINNWTFGAGVELSILNLQNTMLNVWKINAERKITIKKHEYKLYSGFYYRPFSEYLHELNFIFTIKSEYGHFRGMIGNNSRI